MPAYPDIRQSPRRHNVIPDSGQGFERARNGEVWVRSPYTADVFEIQILHPRISTADKDTVVAFWNANKGVKVDFTDKADGQVYSCYIKGRPLVEYVQPDQWDVSVDFIV